jgi:hypothetical protein
VTYPRGARFVKCPGCNAVLKPDQVKLQKAKKELQKNIICTMKSFATQCIDLPKGALTINCEKSSESATVGCGIETSKGA